MAEDSAKKALREAKEAILAVHKGRVEQSGSILFEGVRAYSASKDELIRKASVQTRQDRRIKG